jgi:hypothetical protein
MTTLEDLFGIELPILQAPMAGVQGSGYPPPRRPAPERIQERAGLRIMSDRSSSGRICTVSSRARGS